MSALLHPVGPRAARVYWRRRLVALVALGLVAVLALVAGNALLGRGAAEAAGSPTEDEAAASAPAADAADADSGATTDGPAVCGPETIALALSADERSFGSSAEPVLTVVITNTSQVSCSLDAGEAEREILITSGSDRIWSSTDCPAEPAERMLLLPAGARDEVAVTWDRVRSAEGCPGALPAPRAGTYTAVASVAGVSSTAAVFELK